MKKTTSKKPPFSYTNMLAYLVLLLIFCHNLQAQKATPKPYFQQEVNYDIQVTLNDIEHQLDGKIAMEYTNNSLENLDFIYMHLWPNAYKNTETAFAKQMVENGETDFHFSRPSQRGYIDSLDFKVNEKTVKFQYEATDYGKLMLNKPLKSGETITIETPFRVKIPDSFSRLGHVEQSYQITQWYPKPAVYDRDGWHAMSYLDQGEFYAEFGCFDVKITLPSNYIVGATGDLQNPEEIEFLNKKAQETALISGFDNVDSPEFPESSPVFKTLEYQHCNGIDFAWFADKRFHVLKSEATLQSGRTVDLWSMFTDTESDLWANSIEYIHDGLQFYAEKVGEYPFNQCTAVQSALSAGAGMEYPQVTVIGLSETADALEQVIVHEVGHNWFQAQLATNERDYPFMDEGYNTYYDQRYWREKYPEKMLEIPKPFDLLVNPSEMPYRDAWELAYNFQAHQCKDQACGLHSEDFTNLNYGAMVYTKTGIALDYLSAYLGQEKFDKIMQEIYKRWEFKHPQPEDFQRIFGQLSLKNLDWFFEDLIKTNKKVDYQLWKVAPNAETIGEDKFHQIMVLNQLDNIAGPFSISAIKDGKKVEKIWYEGFTGNEKVLFPAIEYDQLVIDHDHQLPEYNRKNNTIKANGLFKKIEPLKVRMLLNLSNPTQTQLYLTPALAFNKYDGFQLGLATYNNLIPAPKFEYALAGMYGFKSNIMTATGEFAYNHRNRTGKIALIRPALNIRTFTDGEYFIRRGTPAADGIGTDFTTLVQEGFRYTRLAPEIRIEFRPKSMRSTKKHALTFRHIHLLKQDKTKDFDFPTDDEEGVTYPIQFNDYDTPRAYYLNQLIYNFKNSRTLVPFKVNAMVEQHQNFVKLAVEASAKIKYPQKNKGLTLRAFAGGFAWDNGIFKTLQDMNDNNFYRFALNNVGRADYGYDNYWVGRHESSGLWSRQIGDQGFNGGFKSANAYNNGLGADIWLAAVNIELDSPLEVPFLGMLAVYVNMAVNNRSINEQSISLSQNSLEISEPTTGLYTDKVLYELGFAVKVVPDIFEIYLPIGVSDNLKYSTVVSQPYSKEITFKLNINNMNPIKLVKNIEL